MSYVGKPATGNVGELIELFENPFSEPDTHIWFERGFRTLVLAGSVAADGYAISSIHQPSTAIAYLVIGLGLWLIGLADSIKGMFD